MRFSLFFFPCMQWPQNVWIFKPHLKCKRSWRGVLQQCDRRASIGSTKNFSVKWASSLWYTSNEVEEWTEIMSFWAKYVRHSSPKQTFWGSLFWLLNTFSYRLNKKFKLLFAFKQKMKKEFSLKYTWAFIRRKWPLKNILMV